MIRRGTLRVYLGAAPGVGKTFAMLNEGRRAKERGTDVVVGFVETHGRPRTAEQIGDLEVVPRRVMEYRDATFEEMDVDATLARRPERVLVDELAHTNVPGCRNEKRWQDVEELLAAGIDVVSTVNIQHLESINDVVERITGIRQRETIPDDVVRSADQVELVDQTPEALRRRMAHGNIYGPEKVDAALGNYFRVGNLAALRELALLWVADQVDVGLEEYRVRHGIREPWETRERVVVALTGAPAGENLIRRAARIAQRAHGELVGVHIVSEEGLATSSSAGIDEHRRLLEDLGGEFHEASGGDVAAALVDFARAENATQLVLGASQRSRWEELVRGSVINRAIRLSGAIDVHVITEPSNEVQTRAPHARRRFTTASSSLGPRRVAWGWLMALAGVPAMTVVLAQLRGQIGLPTVLLAFLALVVITATVGGTLPALATAVVAFLSANYYFTPPIYTWTIAESENVVALLVFLGTALAVSRFVDAAARRAVEAAWAQRQARTLARLAGAMAEQDPLPVLLEHLRTVFDVAGAAVLRREDEKWRAEAVAGEAAPRRPEDGEVVERLGSDVVLVLTGLEINAQDRAVLNAFAAQLAAALEHGRLRVEAGRSRALADSNALRSALLQAVSHDLRSPLASIKASVTSLSQRDVEWSAEETAEFVQTINDETDRLNALVGNLLDMSRIQVGAVQASVAPVALEEVVPAALVSLGGRAQDVDVDVSETLPPVMADAALLERAVANVIDNAVRFAPEDQPVRITAGQVDGRVDLRVVDKGRGIPVRDRERVFLPFQRLGDSGPGGVGLGLAVAHGFVTAMGGEMEIEDTPGGGATVVMRLPAVA